MKKIFLIAIVIAAFTTAVFAQGGRIGTRQWKLTNLNGLNVEDSTAYLELDDSQSRFSGNAGCNSMFGAVTVRGNRIDFLNVGTTRSS